MYAIIATGGKQYRVAEGDSIKIEKIEAYNRMPDSSRCYSIRNSRKSWQGQKSYRLQV